MIKTESNAEYHASVPLSKSRLWEMRKSPEWFRFCETVKKQQTPAMIVGSLIHTAVLEPEKLSTEYAILNDCDMRTKAGKEARARFLEENKGKTLIEDDEYELALEIARTIEENKIANYLLHGEVEQSVYTVDDLTGVEYKVRPDSYRIVGERGIIVDLKTTNDASTDAFMRDAVKYGYDMQAAMYKAAMEKEFKIPFDFVFVAVEKSEPHMINVMQCDPLLLTRGYDMFREYIGIYKECLETGNWYGYNGKQGYINTLGLPAYLAKEIE